MQDKPVRVAGAADCVSCRATGTLVCLSCSTYLAAQVYTRPAMTRVHRYVTVGFAAGFAVMGVTRAVI